VFPVLFDKLGRKAGQLIGRSPYLQAVHAEALPDLVGRILPVEIANAGPNSLSGVIKTA
jgi:tRNA-2-methylthio-N6-dimethylallyladenosine synthase